MVAASPARPQEARMARSAAAALILSLTCLLASDAPAACTASITASISGTDVTVTGTGSGECGNSSLTFYRNGLSVASASCATPSCSHTFTLSTVCWKTGNHTLSVVATCSRSSTDANGNQTCVADTSGQAETTVSVNTTPEVAITYAGPDQFGAGTATITYSFPNTAATAHRRIRWELLSPSGTRVTSGESTYQQQSGTTSFPLNVTCRKGGTYTLRATAWACGTVSPTTYPTDPAFIATDDTIIVVPSPKPFVDISYSGPDATGAGTATINYAFPNTSASSQRRIRWELFNFDDVRVAFGETTYGQQSGTTSFASAWPAGKAADTG
jgi:hypothetical protein